ncbi:MAG: nodulation protein NfeD [Novosphingobium sp.]|nr:nodulation protein NfeD [Novosphingobium sp.]
MATVALGAIGLPVKAKPSPGTAIVLKLDGAIGPASASYLIDGLEQAREEGAALTIIEMDTPGGLDTSMREIIQEILAMPVPVVTYVHPSGARAASAGTYILYASHVAAMTPGTNLGAATPIQIGAPPGQPSEPGKAGDAEDAEAAAPKNASERKAVNDAVAYIRSLAELRGRNADWGEKAVREAASLSASSALDQNVIDIVAPDLDSLLKQLDGRTVSVMGQERQLSTANLAISQVEPDWLDRLLATITNPNVALILMMIGVYGLFFEFWNPGSFVPGTIGAISLLVALYALAALPVDIAGVALILLGLALMVAEAFAPSFGILGIGGLAAFVFGAVIMFDTDVPQFRIDWSVIAAVALFSAGLLIAVARVGIRSLRRRVETGSEELIGARAKVLDWKSGEGHVFVHSERWNATGPDALEKGATVTVEGISGLQLEVSLPGESVD